MKDRPVILVVDDQPQNIGLLEAHLAPQGYEIITAAGGEEALEKVSGGQIDLILLDVMMPGMNGYEICRILKQKSDYLPVIMITSLGDRDSRIKGIESGADDFLSKPFDATELKLKIRNFLKTKDFYDKVEKSYLEIKALDALKDDLTSFIVHDLKNPLIGIAGYLDLLSTSENLERQNIIDIEGVKQSVEMMMGMISDLLDLAKMENNEMEINAEECELEEIVASAIKAVMPMLNEKSLHFFDNTKVTKARVTVQKDLIRRIVQNLLSNAIHYTPKQGSIWIESKLDKKTKMAMVSVSDSGDGIPREYQQKVFDKFSTVETKENRIRGSSGLGLAFCKLAVELHGGKIWVENRSGGGSIFRFTLPLFCGERKIG